LGGLKIAEKNSSWRRLQTYCCS